MNEELITYEQPNSAIAETFRSLRTNILFTKTRSNQEIKTILVTSFESGEGKSLVSSNLAISFAQKNDNVLLLDVDMRRGRQHEIFKSSLTPGLSDILSTKMKEGEILSLVKYVNETMLPNLKVISKGNCPKNPTELLMNKQTVFLINEMRDVADRVIIDAPPLMAVTDTSILASKVDGIIIVVEQGKRKSEELKKMIKDLKKAGGNIIGIVFNKVPYTRKSYGSNSYYYGNSLEKYNKIKGQHRK